MLRVTTNSTIYTYQKNLLKSTNQLYSAMSAMMSGRNFDSYSADPAAATRAFKIHSSLNATNAQYSNNTTVLNKFSTAWDVADDMIDKLVSDLAQAPALKGLSDTNLSTLNTQGDVIYSGAEVDEPMQKMALLGALSLYLDFINLFLYMLRLLGNRR